SIHNLIQYKQVKVILLISKQDAVDSVQAIQMGVSGILLNLELDDKHLIDMLYSIYEGHKFMSCSLTPEVLQVYYALIQGKTQTDKSIIQAPTHDLTKEKWKRFTIW